MMALTRWDPARDTESLQADFNRFFEGFLGRPVAGARRWAPAMDLSETEDALVLRADLPGLDRDDVSFEIKDNVLTVSGERRAEHEDKREGYHRIERSHGAFSRSVTLPRGIDPAAVSAGFEKGVLEVRIPKPEERKPHRVEIGEGATKGGAIEGEATDTSDSAEKVPVTAA
jgi:HSP20 family protein